MPATSAGLTRLSPSATTGPSAKSTTVFWSTSSSAPETTYSIWFQSNPYIYSSQIVEDNYNPTAVTKTVNQTLDQYGNTTQTQVYDYGNNSTPARTYTNTYLTDTNHTSRYMFNRLASSVVTDGTKSTTLVQNTYDATTPADLSGITAHDATYNTALLTRGNVTTSVTPAGTSIANYDIGGNVTLSIVNGVTTTVATSITTNYAAPSTISVNLLSSTMNWNAALFPTSEVGPNGDTASIGYSSGRPGSTTSPFGAVTTYAYTDSAPASKTATTGTHWVKTTMDGFGRTTKTETGTIVNAISTTVSTVETGYVSCGCSPLGKMGKQSQPYAPGDQVNWTTYTYDGMGRTLSVLAPDGASTTNYSYSGNTVTVTDPAGKWKTFTMDAFGNLTKVQEPDPTLGTVTTNYTYDILNHLIYVSMPRGANTQTRTFVYNTGNTVGVRLLSAMNPENGTVSYTYNPDGTLNTKTDANNQTFTYTYDSYKRLYQIILNNTPLRTYSYDTNPYDGSFSQFTKGRLTAVQHASFNPGNIIPQMPIQFTEMYSYTQPGQVSGKRLQVTETLPYGQNLTIPRTLNLDATQTYDTEGKMTSVLYPTTYAWNGVSLVSTSGNIYSYQFDNMHRPNLLTDQQGNPVANNVQYGPANQLLSISYGPVNNLVTETREYNAMLQMKHLSIYTGLTGQLDINYNFPTSTNNGKITSQTDNLSGETISYQYDSLNRLLSASASGWNQTFGYDGFGSLVSKSGTNAPVLSIGVDPATNRINSPYQPYDANGNQLTGGLGYDPENRIQTAPGVQYAYDSQNKRIWRGTFDGNGNLTAQEAYFYGVGGQKLGTYALTVVQQNNQQPQLTDSNTDSAVFFGGKRILTGSGTFIQDRLGSARRSQSGAAMSFYAYGEDKGTTQANDQLKFATYTRDTATGLDYADQRYYANNYGRFMSPDPSKASAGPQDPATWNHYSYVGGDPVNRLDPQGLDWEGVGYLLVGVIPATAGSVTGYGFQDGDPPGGVAVGVGGRGHAMVALAIGTLDGPISSQGCVPTPEHMPSDETLKANVDRAQQINVFLIAAVANGLDQVAADAYRLAWITSEVSTGMEMDYKQQSASFREFGNFNFGAVGAALGLSPSTLFLGAGVASQGSLLKHDLLELALQAASRGKYQPDLSASHPTWGSPFTGPPYGDNPQEQFEIARGFAFYRRGCL